MQISCMLSFIGGIETLRKLVLTLVISVITVLLIYAAGVWFDTLLPE